MNLNELYRLICNLARIGTVLEVDTEKYLARVETGENKTDWIRWAVPRAGEAVTWWAPTVGEQVYILCPCGEMETAFIAGSLYSEDAPPPDAGATTCVILHPDGARISYDPEASALVVSGVKTASVTASESITATVPVVTVKADTRVTRHAGSGLHQQADHRHAGSTKRRGNEGQYYSFRRIAFV